MTDSELQLYEAFMRSKEIPMTDERNLIERLRRPLVTIEIPKQERDE